MERKIRLLTLLIFTFSSSIILGQGFVLDTCLSFKVTTDTTSNTEYFIYNFNPDSTIEIPLYAYCKRSEYFVNLLDQWYLTKRNTIHPHVLRLVKNLPVGRNVHYLQNGNIIVICSPETNLIATYNTQSKALSFKTIKGAPFGLAFSKSTNEIFVSGLFSRCIISLDLSSLETIDSIPINGHSGRFLFYDSISYNLFVGVRSSKSICKVNLRSRKTVEFHQTNNLPGPIIGHSHQLYYLQANKAVFAKFDMHNMQLLESRRLNGITHSILFNPNNLAFTFDADIPFCIKDSLSKNPSCYKDFQLDSSGRYTWVINSYTNPKWALLVMSQFKESGIKCYLSSLNDGYLRLCAGLYQNQETAVKQQHEFPELFDGAWLMTIHPHKF